MLFFSRKRWLLVLFFWSAISVAPSQLPVAVAVHNGTTETPTNIKCPEHFPLACPHGRFVYQDFAEVAQPLCYAPSLAWRRLVFQETSNTICQGDCETVVLSTPLRRIGNSDVNDDSNDHDCNHQLCRRISRVIQESCWDEEPSAMDAYDVAYRVSYMSARRPVRHHHRRLGQIVNETNGCWESSSATTTYSSTFYSVGLGIVSGLLTSAVVLWLYVFYTHLERRRRRLRLAMRMLHQAETTVSSKTSIVSSNEDDASSNHDGPPVPPELYATTADRMAPRMIQRTSEESHYHNQQQEQHNILADRLEEDDILINDESPVVLSATSSANVSSDCAIGSKIFSPGGAAILDPSYANTSSPRSVMMVMDAMEDPSVTDKERPRCRGYASDNTLESRCNATWESHRSSERGCKSGL